MKKTLEITTLEELENVEDLTKYDYLIIKDTSFYHKVMIVYPGMDTERVRWYVTKLFQLKDKLYGRTE